ncbi:MAG: hypothetical protein ABEJ28_09375 [Salinigranum sp.]
MSRGQAHTLEAFAAAVVLLASLTFALQVTAVTPLTASTSSQHIENQQAAVAGSLLGAAAANGTLKPSVLFWNSTGHRFYNATRKGAYPMGGPPTAFGRALNRTFVSRGFAVDVNVYYLDPGPELRRHRQRMVDFGQPSDHGTSATYTLTLYDDDVLYDQNGPTGTRINDSAFYAPDAFRASPAYNVIVVEVVVWRM